MPNLHSIDEVLGADPGERREWNAPQYLRPLADIGRDSKRCRPPSTAISNGTSSRISVQAQMSPGTPGSPLDAAPTQPAQALFHNYLRAFHAFSGAATELDGTDQSLVTASIEPGDLILVHSIHATGWADGTVLTTGERGWLPTNYCEAFDHPYLRDLLNAMTQFWDLLGASEESNLSAFVRQDYIRGLIAGVRYLLEHAGCLHRDAKLVQRHSGIRRMRKGLLADLSTLVQIAKNLQETIGEPFGGEMIHYLLDDLIGKAFKVVTRAVGFVDMWTKETGGETVHETVGMDQITEQPEPQAATLSVDISASKDSITHAPTDLARALPATSQTTQDAVPGAERESTINVSPGPHALEPEQVPSESMVLHPVPSVPHRSSPCEDVITAQLSKAHDHCISNIGAFIGYHLHSRPASELVKTTDKVVNGCKEIIAVIEELYARGLPGCESVRAAQGDFEAMMEDLVKATGDVFKFSDSEESAVVMLPDQTNRLVTIGAGLIRAAGDLVLRARSAVKRSGDLEVLRARPAPPTAMTESADDTSREPQTELLREPAYAAKGATSFEKRLSRKLLPPLPPPLPTVAPELSGVTEVNTLSAFASDQQRPTTAASHTSSDLLPGRSMRRHSAIRMSQNLSGISLTSPSSPRLRSISPARKGSLGPSIAGSTDTKRSSVRDSGNTGVSETSTRATTPDRPDQSKPSPDTALLNSFASVSSIQSLVNEAAQDAEALLLRQTFASELILNQHGQITGGSLSALVEQLTMHDAAPDPQFVATFYLTFRMFATPRELAQALINRFEYVGDDREVGTPARLRIYNVFKGWLETYWSPEFDEAALGDIRCFALQKMKPHLPSAGERLLGLIGRVTASYMNGAAGTPLVSGVGKTSLALAGQQTSSANAREPIISKKQLNALRAISSNGQHCSILDFDPLEIARQMTLITSKIYCSIRPDELLSLDWTTKDTQKAPNVRAMCTINTDVAHIVGDTILASDDMSKRAVVIKQWVKIATHCLELNNYDTVMGILCSINSSVVQRLKRTWEAVSKKTKARLAHLNEIMDYSRNYASLRSRIENPTAPCIPFLGIYLTDLTFLDAGNSKLRELPSAASSDGKTVYVINFDKHMRMAKVISHLQKFQVPYHLQPVPELQAFIELQMGKMRASDEEMANQLYRRSLMVEPRLPTQGGQQQQSETRPPPTIP